MHPPHAGPEAQRARRSGRDVFGQHLHAGVLEVVAHQLDHDVAGRVHLRSVREMGTIRACRWRAVRALSRSDSRQR